MFDDDFEENPDKWTEAGALTAADRRELFVKWLSESWKQVQAEKQPQIRKAFQRCGMLNAVDGSEDSLIKVQGYDGPYSLDSDDDEGELSDGSDRSVMSSSDDPESDTSSDEEGSDDDMTE